jgi:alpha-tubulin suppressor-like RCC1 family protein
MIPGVHRSLSPPAGSEDREGGGTMKTTATLGLGALFLQLAAASAWADLPLKNVTQISVGGEQACALRSSGDAKCCGNNSGGQLGTGDQVSSVFARSVLLSGASSIAVGQSFNGHACALFSGGDVKCWGSAQSGKLGYGSPLVNLSSPPASPALSGATAIATGDSHTCVVLSGGDVKCWGNNQNGELRTGNRKRRRMVATYRATRRPRW